MVSETNLQESASKVAKVLSGQSTDRHHLLTLWDMMQFAIGAYTTHLSWLNRRIEVAFNYQEERPDSKPDREWADSLKELLGPGGDIGLAGFCATLGLESTCRVIEDALSTLDNSKVPLFVVIYSKLCVIRDTLAIEMNERRLAYVPRALVDYFENDDLFGNDVKLKFKEAVPWIRDAGNCISLGLDTTAVFLLMRVVEYGARVLASRLRCPFVKGMDFSTLGDLNREIRARVEKKYEHPRKSRRDKLAREYYSGLQIGIAGMMAIWRNPVAHVRGTYCHEEAIMALKHTEQFMRSLAAGAPKVRKK